MASLASKDQLFVPKRHRPQRWPGPKPEHPGDAGSVPARFLAGV